MMSKGKGKASNCKGKGKDSQNKGKSKDKDTKNESSKKSRMDDKERCYCQETGQVWSNCGSRLKVLADAEEGSVIANSHPKDTAAVVLMREPHKVTRQWEQCIS